MRDGGRRSRRVGAASKTGQGGAWSIDWARVLRRMSILAPLAAAALELVLQTRMDDLGFDFRGAVWGAGRAILAGHSPYAPADPAWLLHHGNGFVNSPVLGLLGIPFGLLPFTPALIAFDLLGAAAVIGGLRVVGIRDRRIQLACLCSFPFISASVLGQPDALLALLAAVGWRYRDSWPGGLTVGALIATKFLMGPLLAWLFFTRRFRQAVTAVLTIPVALLIGFAGLDFRGWGAFPSLLRADATAFQGRSYSVVGTLIKHGLAEPAATTLAVAIALGIATAIVVVARGSDLGWFVAAITFGLLCSPILWQHYLIVLLIPVAIASRDRFDTVSWALVGALWLAPRENPHASWQAWLVLVLVSAIGLRTAAVSASSELRPAGPPQQTWATTSPVLSGPEPGASPGSVLTTTM